METPHNKKKKNEGPKFNQFHLHSTSQVMLFPIRFSSDLLHKSNEPKKTKSLKSFHIKNHVIL